jgi:hypothetical protein
MWVHVPIGAPSVAGTQYAIVLSSAASDCIPNCWQWAFFEGNPAPYGGGAAYLSDDGGATWALLVANDPDADFAFRTFVSPPLPDAAMRQPSPGLPLTSVGFGLLLIGSLGVLVVGKARSPSR